MARLIPLLILLTACGSGPNAGADFGFAPLTRELFLDLDSALTGEVGQPLIVFAQENLGQGGPVAESQLGRVRFQGDLVSADDGWVSLFRVPNDTVRISKGHVTGIWRMTPPARNRSTVLGAVFFGLTALAVMRIDEPQDQPSGSVQLGIVGGSALLGGLLGDLLFGGPRRGEQLYPLRRSRE